MPILYKGETLGVLEQVNKANQAYYTQEDLTILATLASQAATALQNARRLNKAKNLTINCRNLTG